MFQYWTYTHSLDIIQSGIVFIKIAEMYGKSIHVHRSDLRSVDIHSLITHTYPCHKCIRVDHKSLLQLPENPRGWWPHQKRKRCHTKTQSERWDCRNCPTTGSRYLGDRNGSTKKSWWVYGRFSACKTHLVGQGCRRTALRFWCYLFEGSDSQLGYPLKKPKRRDMQSYHEVSKYIQEKCQFSTITSQKLFLYFFFGVE